jgi:hypothetical protein
LIPSSINEHTLSITDDAEEPRYSPRPCNHPDVWTPYRGDAILVEADSARCDFSSITAELQPPVTADKTVWGRYAYFICGKGSRQTIDPSLYICTEASWDRVPPERSMDFSCKLCTSVTYQFVRGTAPKAQPSTEGLKTGSELSIDIPLKELSKEERVARMGQIALSQDGEATWSRIISTAM